MYGQVILTRDVPEHGLRGWRCRNGRRATRLVAGQCAQFQFVLENGAERIG
jgi:hypothetical protein